MESLKRFFTTGEFAEICGVKKKTLFHYDEINLFKPEKVMENGYRYYSYHQLEVFNVILVLKEIGMPLKDIKNFLDKRNPQNTIELFKYEKNQVEKEIENLKRIKNILEVKLESINSGINSSEELFLEEVEEENLILSEPIQETDEEYDIGTYTEHVKYCIKNELNYGYPVGAIISKENLMKNNFDKYSFYFTKLPKGKKHNETIKKPKGLYLIGYSHGYYDKTYKVYEKMARYIKDNNLYISGYSYEEAIIDEISTSIPKDFVFKISIKVDKILL